MIAPTDESKSLVLDWLSHQGLADKSVVSSRGNAVTVTASIEEIEKLLEADYETYSEFLSFIKFQSSHSNSMQPTARLESRLSGRSNTAFRRAWTAMSAWCSRPTSSASGPS